MKRLFVLLYNLLMVDVSKMKKKRANASSNTQAGLAEWAIIELQGDLETRDGEDMSNQFIGDLYYNKYGQPIMIIGHHMLQGREQKIDKPYAVLEKTRINIDDDDDRGETDLANELHPERLENQTQYTIRAIVTKKLIFKARPKPIIANTLEAT